MLCQAESRSSSVSCVMITRDSRSDAAVEALVELHQARLRCRPAAAERTFLRHVFVRTRLQAPMAPHSNIKSQIREFITMIY